MQADTYQDISVETLFQKSEKMRKTIFAHHAAVTAQIVSTNEQLDWVTQEMMKLKRQLDGDL